MEVGHTVSKTMGKVIKAWPLKKGKTQQMVNLTWFDKETERAHYIMAFISSQTSVDFLNHIGEIVVLSAGTIVITDNVYKNNHTNQLSCDGVKVEFGMPNYNDSPKSSEATPSASNALPEGKPVSLFGSAKDKSITIQAFLKSIIEAGTPKDQWEPCLDTALALHSKKMNE